MSMWPTWAYCTFVQFSSDCDGDSLPVSVCVCQWGLGALEEQNRDVLGFLIMPKRPYEWRVHSHGCYKFDNATLGLGPRDQSAHLPVFLHLRTVNLPGPSSVMRSGQAQQRRCERRRNKERMQRRRS